MFRFILGAAIAVGACGDGGGESAGDQADAGESSIFANLVIEDVSAYRAVVRFDTTIETTCALRFGTAAGSLGDTATDPNMEPGTFQVEHQVPLEDLSPGTTYFFAPFAEDRDGNSYQGKVYEFSTGPGLPVDTLSNVALLSAGTSIAGVSSNWGGDLDSSFGAKKAIDGQMSSEWSSSGDGDDAYLEIELDQEREFSVVGFRSRKMSDGTSIIQSFDLLLDDETVLGPFLSPDPDIRYLFTLDGPRSATRIRLRAIETTGGNTGAKELQLFSPED